MIVGLVGKPSAGKSTFFKAATLAEVDIAPYPFTTIAKNEGIGYVKVDCVEKSFNIKCKPKFGYCLDAKRFVPFQLIDVAGLVPDAHLGKGRGNQFLDDLRQADVLIHVVDISGSLNANGEQVETGSYDPVKDIEFLEVEIDMWYLNIIKANWEKFARTVQQEKQDIVKAMAKQLSGLKVTEDMTLEVIEKLKLNKGNIISWTDDNLKKIATELRKKTKPMIIAANKIDVNGAREKFDEVVKKFPDLKIIGCSAESELALKEAAKHNLIDYVPGESDFNIKGDGKLNEQQKKALEFIKSNILAKHKTTGVQDVLNYAVFELLKCIHVYPVANAKFTDKDGNVLPDCLIVPDGTTALEFAFKVHTDIGNSFIRAIDLKTKQTIGKEHKLKDGDVVEIVAGK